MSPKDEKPQQWTPPAGAEEQEATLAEFWKPAAVGDTAVGVLTEIREGHFGQFITLSPVVMFPKGKPPQGYASIKVSNNTWLEKLIDPSLKASPIAIVFSGAMDTPNGKMRTYRVYKLELQEWRKTLAEHAPEAMGESDLPF
jgi:hypothetical protein